MIYFLSFIFIISLPIFLHELGHFLAARSVGIKVEKFYFGFNFFGLGIKTKYKETEYGIGLFPLGGYVKVAGILDESLDKNTETEKKDYEFRSKNVFQKLWFLSAGVIMNFILSTFIFTCIYYSNGIEEFIDKPIIGDIQNEVMTFDANKDLIPVKAPAKILGLKKGDEILTINGYKINSWTDIGEIISPDRGSLAHITWKRENKFYDGETYILSSPIQKGFAIEERGILGIIASSNHKDLTILESIEESVSTTYAIIKGTFYGVVGLISGGASVGDGDRPGTYTVELDRAKAIALAVHAARPEDAVLIAGKGHEDYQIIGGERRDFDDRQCARQALETIRGAH